MGGYARRIEICYRRYVPPTRGTSASSKYVPCGSLTGRNCDTYHENHAFSFLSSSFVVAFCRRLLFFVVAFCRLASFFLSSRFVVWLLFFVVRFCCRIAIFLSCCFVVGLPCVCLALLSDGCDIFVTCTHWTSCAALCAHMCIACAYLSDTTAQCGSHLQSAFLADTHYLRFCLAPKANQHSRKDGGNVFFFVVRVCR